jgi:outer membrane protein
LNSFTLKAAILAFALLFPVGAAAAPVSGRSSVNVPVHLDEATGMAVRNRPELRMELEKQEIARSKVKEARGNFLPTLDLSGSSYYIRNFDTFTGIDIQAQILGQNVSVNMENDVPSYMLNGELSFFYNLYSGGRDSALFHEAVSNLESGKLRESLTLRKIRLEVANAYWGLTKAQVRYEMATRELAVVRFELKVAETQHRTGRMSDIDYDAVLLKRREKEVALKAADRDCLKAFGSYRNVLGMPEDITAPSSEQIPPLADDPGSGNIYNEEKRDHLEILRLRSELQAASQRKKAARSVNYPHLDLFAKYSLVGRDSASYFDSWGNMRSENYMAGLKITWNLFNGFRTKEQISQADAEERAKRFELAEKKREVAEAERNGKAVLETANDDLSLALERMKLEQEREKVAASRFRSGRISELEYRQKAAVAAIAVDEVRLARIDVALADNVLSLLVLK